MKLLQKKYGLAALFLLLLFLLFYNTDHIGQLMYPIKYKEEIHTSAENFDISPLFIASIIRTESNYKPHLASQYDAVGLMQIMPDTADWIISRGGYPLEMKDQMTDAKINIEMGTWYIHWLTDHFKDQLSGQISIEDQISIIAAAYNAGHNRVSQWLDNETWDGQYNTREQIPFGETRHYIKRVLYYYKKYHAFYSDDWFHIKSKEALNSLH